MKIKTEHLETLAEAIRKVKEAHPDVTLQSYIDNKIGKDHKLRWRWDVFWAAQKYLPEGFKRGGRGNCSVLSDYMDNSHIDTALRHILRDDLNAVA